MPIQSWQQSESINNFISTSNFEIKPLTDEMIPAVLALTNANKNLPGFFQMSPDVFRQEDNLFSQCLKSNNEMGCMLATDKSNGNIIGFVVIIHSNDTSCILELGVDKASSFDRTRPDTIYNTMFYNIKHKYSPYGKTNKIYYIYI